MKNIKITLIIVLLLCSCSNEIAGTKEDTANSNVDETTSDKRDTSYSENNQEESTTNETTDYITTYEETTYENAEEIKSVTISKYDYAFINEDFLMCFAGMDKLENIYADEDNEYFSSIDGVLFNKSKTELLAYPQGRKETEYTIPEGVTGIFVTAFSKCRLEQIHVPDSLMYYNFACEFLKEIEWSKNAVHVGVISSKVITEIVFPDTVTTIGNQYSAFYGCENVKKVVISKNIETIDGYPFENMKNLEEIIVDSENEHFTMYNGVLCTKDLSRMIKLPPKSNVKKIIIPKNIEFADLGVFANNEFIETVVIEEGAGKYIDFNLMSPYNGDFDGCVNLKSIYVPESFLFDEWVVRDCPNVTIYTVSGSSAEKTAIENNIPYVIQ